jgi:hypothetical protein
MSELVPIGSNRAIVAHAPRLRERTPYDWRELLAHQLNVRAVEVALFEAYYDGEHPLQFATSKFREAFGALFGAFADNWCQIVVDAAVERLKIVGFRTGGKTSDDAWSIWQSNALDVQSVIAHTEAGKCGRVFLLVDPRSSGCRAATTRRSCATRSASSP